MKVIDATGLILGRMATRVAKMALAGDDVKIVNCEKAVISGRQNLILARWRQRKARTDPFKGPFISILPDRIVRRTIYGMLPHKRKTEKSRGILAFKHVMCYISVPDILKNQKFETVQGAESDRLKTEYITIGRLSQLLRTK
ncbi:MAG: 50S ribosomal protein L13 [DPANN group archaeon]|nr:50S ribosomal protein L13 [DPANN group archaeon]